MARAKNHLTLWDGTEIPAAMKEPKAKAESVSTVGTERCPSCRNMRFLVKGHYALLCQECHDDIARLAIGRFW